MRDNKNLFKIIFCIVAVLFTVLVGGLTFLFFANVTIAPEERVIFTVFSICGLLVLLIPILIGVFVYKDSKKLGFNPWLWMLVAMFAPSGIGIIIYLIYRTSEKKKNLCPKCGAYVENDFSNCPMCGEEMNDKCTSCGKNVHRGWKVCPYCSKQLNRDTKA